ncbi:MAG: hypothetical protein ABIT37_02065 [Luteolibacter sp.]
MSSDIQFERAEFSQTPEMACSSCKMPLAVEYFALNQQTFCRNCADQVRKVLGGEGSGMVRFLQAILLGSGAALLGMAAYAAIMIFTNSEWALISIALGWFVGAAVRRGSKGRGGWRYQLLAVFLTYTAICAAYGISIWHQMPAEQHSGQMLVGIIVTGYAIPFLGGAENIMGILIIGFGIWRAWQMNRRIRLEVTGPHVITTNSTQPPVSHAGI